MNLTRFLVLALALTIVFGLVGCNQSKTETAANQSPATQSSMGGSAPGGDAPSGEKRVVTVYAPCGLTFPIREAAAAFEEAHPDVQIDTTFDTGHVNAFNIRDKDESADVFVSAGKRELELLEEADLVDPNAETAIGYFELIVAVAKGNPLGIEELGDLTKVDVITMPDPEMNSIGVYGSEALKNAGIWDTIMPAGDEHVVMCEKPISAYDKVAAGKSDAAIMFENCPMQTYTDKMEEVGSVEIACVVDTSLYEIPYCLAAPLKNAANPEDAQAFITFLRSPETQALMKENGLKTLEGTPQAEGAPSAGAGGGDETAAAPGDVIEVEAWYPDNEGHAYIHDIIAEIEKRYPGKVHVEFLDWAHNDDLYQRYRELGWHCAGWRINGENTVKVDRDGVETEVWLTRGQGGEWNPEDIYAYLDKLTKAS